jgi:hypothetical protein
MEQMRPAFYMRKQISRGLKLRNRPDTFEFETVNNVALGQLLLRKWFNHRKNKPFSAG